MMIDIEKILYEICEDENVFDPDFDLAGSGLLDSLAFIELFSRLEDEGVFLQPTRIDRELLKTPAGIGRLVEDYLEQNRQ